LRSSPWMRGAPQSGLARLISRISRRTSNDTCGLPARRRDFQRQKRAQACLVPADNVFRFSNRDRIQNARFASAAAIERLPNFKKGGRDLPARLWERFRKPGRNCYSASPRALRKPLKRNISLPKKPRQFPRRGKEGRRRMAPPKAEHPYKFLIGTKPIVLSRFCAELVCQVCENSHCKSEKSSLQ